MIDYEAKINKFQAKVRKEDNWKNVKLNSKAPKAEKALTTILFESSTTYI
jgi:hypothetical protein